MTGAENGQGLGVSLGPGTTPTTSPERLTDAPLGSAGPSAGSRHGPTVPRPSAHGPAPPPTPSACVSPGRSRSHRLILCVHNLAGIRDDAPPRASCSSGKDQGAEGRGRGACPQDLRSAWCQSANREQRAAPASQRVALSAKAN